MTIILLLLIASTASAQWSAGAAKVDITPSESIWMAGYAARTKPSEGVRQRIWAKSLALRDSAGQTSVLVTLDLVSIRHEMAEEIAAQVKSKYQVPRERLLFNASHTHSAPLTGDISSYRHIMGDRADEQSKMVNRYTASLREKIIESIGKSIANLAPATLHFEQGFAGFAVNRRRAWKRELPGPVDHDVPVLVARAPGGAIRAIAFGYACHNTVLGDYLINGDYAGYAQETIESANPGAIALFVQGAGADSNPLPRRSEELARRYGQTLADAVDQVVKAKMRLLTPPLAATMETIDLRFQGPPARAELQSRLKDKDPNIVRHSQRLLAQLDRDGRIPASHTYPIQAWKFGADLTLLALGGELVVDYSLRFKKRYGWEKLWVAGYSNDVFGYVPSLRVLREGGYEGGGAMIFGGLTGPFSEEVEDSIAAAVEKVMRP